MTKAYLLVYNSEFGSRERVKSHLNAMPEVTHWRYDMPNAFYLISESSAEHLAHRLHELGGKEGLFVVTEFSGNEQGWLTKDSWYLINNKNYNPETERS